MHSEMDDEAYTHHIFEDKCECFPSVDDVVKRDYVGVLQTSQEGGCERERKAVRLLSRS